MRKTTLLSAALLCSVLLSCKKENGKTTATIPAKPEAKQYEQLEKMNWLLGSWGHTSKEGALAENWIKANDSVYKGESFFIIGKDTVFAEYVDLSEANGKLTYTVSVKGQNNEKPVPFTMTSSTGNITVFENPEHDFPNTITYSKINNDSLVATISGMQKGEPAQQTFAMKRKK